MGQLHTRLSSSCVSRSLAKGREVTGTSMSHSFDPMSSPVLDDKADTMAGTRPDVLSLMTLVVSEKHPVKNIRKVSSRRC